MNFNFTQNAEYTLNTSLVTEMINLYGVLTKFLIVERVNLDDNVFGDFSHLKTNNEDIFEMYMLPENTEDWDNGGYNMLGMGLTNFENITLFVAKSNFDNVIELPQITGNLIIFPNNKIMEITDTDPVVPGVNNLFTFNDAKSVYKLTCKPYATKLTDELDTKDISVTDEVPYESLDHYFDELISVSDAQDTEAEVTEQVPTVIKVGDTDTIVNKPIVNNDETDVFGNFS